jgi:hypothetical protein
MDTRENILDSFGKVVGYMSENGFLYDNKHDLLGFVSQLGTVRDVLLLKVGSVNMRHYRFPYEAGREAFFLLQK